MSDERDNAGIDRLMGGPPEAWTVTDPMLRYCDHANCPGPDCLFGPDNRDQPIMLSVDEVDHIRDHADDPRITLLTDDWYTMSARLEALERVSAAARLWEEEGSAYKASGIAYSTANHVGTQNPAALAKLAEKNQSANGRFLDAAEGLRRAVAALDGQS